MVWAVKEEILNGKVSRVIPYHMKKNYDHIDWDDYILCSLTVDEYAQIEDRQQHSQDNWNKGLEKIKSKKNG